MAFHAVRQLFNQSKALSSRPYIGRGSHSKRCEMCRQPPLRCICDMRPEPASSAAFLLLMYQGEVFKPSNTGWLIADVVTDCYAFNWSRTEPDAELLALLNSSDYQPFVIFPGEYAQQGREVCETLPELESGKTPLFILLDGSWREACKMFRKSPYLDRFPLLSFSPETLSRFALRTAAREHQLATAEVAAQALALYGDKRNAKRLDAWFDCYSQASLSEARRQRQSLNS